MTLLHPLRAVLGASLLISLFACGNKSDHPPPIGESGAGGGSPGPVVVIGSGASSSAGTETGGTDGFGGTRGVDEGGSSSSSFGGTEGSFGGTGTSFGGTGTSFGTAGDLGTGGS